MCVCVCVREREKERERERETEEGEEEQDEGLVIQPTTHVTLGGRASQTICGEEPDI